MRKNDNGEIPFHEQNVYVNMHRTHILISYSYCKYNMIRQCCSIGCDKMAATTRSSLLPILMTNVCGNSSGEGVQSDDI